MGSGANHGRAEAVLETLRDPAWDFRTVKGIAHETGLSPETIEHILSNNGEVVRESRLLDGEYRELFALRSKSVTWRERLAILRMYLTNGVK